MNSASAPNYRKFIWAGAALAAVLIIGTIGFWFIGGRHHSVVDVLYMTVITISTIGYGEIIDLSGNPGGRIFTMFIALFGIGTLFYIITSFTALTIEGDLTRSFWRRRMERKARNSSNHYIVCGIGRLGAHIVEELHATGRPHVVIDTHAAHIERLLATFADEVSVEGDATDNDVLLRAGIEKARGLFAVTGDDNKNLVISLTAKQINPSVRVVARCNETQNRGKMLKAGADAVVSPELIGGLRMASEMVRPTVVSFLDVMLRDREKNLRLEEVSVPEAFVGRPISALQLRKHPNVLLLAVKRKSDWVYNPPDDYVVGPDHTLVFMSTPEERLKLESLFSDGS